MFNFEVKNPEYITDPIPDDFWDFIKTTEILIENIINSGENTNINTYKLLYSNNDLLIFNKNSWILFIFLNKRKILVEKDFWDSWIDYRLLKDRYTIYHNYDWPIENLQIILQKLFSDNILQHTEIGKIKDIIKDVNAKFSNIKF